MLTSRQMMAMAPEPGLAAIPHPRRIGSPKNLRKNGGDATMPKAPYPLARAIAPRDEPRVRIILMPCILPQRSASGAIRWGIQRRLGDEAALFPLGSWSLLTSAATTWAVTSAAMALECRTLFHIRRCIRFRTIFGRSSGGFTMR